MQRRIIKIIVLMLAPLLVLSLDSAVAGDDNKKSYGQQELDQMMAPVALYPDSLLSQILMASTYPDEVTEAVKWSKDNTDKKGDAAVSAVQTKSWDPSVMSLTAFPTVLDMMGKKPDWVKDMGNAFLSAPENVMDTVQSLRKKAKDEGNLESTKEQKVDVTEESGEQIIIIEPSDPTIVYVPTYNPTIIYGTWWWPAYTPYYYYPVGYGFGTGLARGIGFGIGIGITNALWGGFNWHSRSVNINVRRHNNININTNRINSSNRNATWNRSTRNNINRTTSNSQINRQNASNRVKGADQRNSYRGRDADRANAKASLESRGIDPAKARQDLKGSGGAKTRDTLKQSNNNFDSSKVSKNIDRNKVSNIDRSNISNIDRSKAANFDANRKSNISSNRSFNDNAFSDIGSAGRSSSSINRGTASNRSFQNSGGFNRGGGGVSRGGGGFSRGGGGGGGRRR